MPRVLKKRAPVAIAPVMISQLNSEPGIGVDHRRFLDQVVPLCRPHVMAVGRLRIVPLEVALDALQQMVLSGDSDPPADDHADVPAQPETEDAVLAELGLEVVR
jgi:hypothetical protein